MRRDRGEHPARSTPDEILVGNQAPEPVHEFAEVGPVGAGGLRQRRGVGDEALPVGHLRLLVDLFAALGFARVEVPLVVGRGALRWVRVGVHGQARRTPVHGGSPSEPTTLWGSGFSLGRRRSIGVQPVYPPTASCRTCAVCPIGGTGRAAPWQEQAQCRRCALARDCGARWRSLLALRTTRGKGTLMRRFANLAVLALLAASHSPAVTREPGPEQALRAFLDGSHSGDLGAVTSRTPTVRRWRPRTSRSRSRPCRAIGGDEGDAQSRWRPAGI